MRLPIRARHQSRKWIGRRGSEAAKAGFWHYDPWGRDYPRVQLLTIEEVFGGKKVDYPGRDVTLQAAPAEAAMRENLALPGVPARPRKKR